MVPESVGFVFNEILSKRVRRPNSFGIVPDIAVLEILKFVKFFKTSALGRTPDIGLKSKFTLFNDHASKPMPNAIVPVIELYPN